MNVFEGTYNNYRGAEEDEGMYYCNECVLSTNSFCFLSLRVHNREGVSQRDKFGGNALGIGAKGCVSKVLLHF